MQRAARGPGQEGRRGERAGARPPLDGASLAAAVAAGRPVPPVRPSGAESPGGGGGGRQGQPRHALPGRGTEVCR